MSDDYKIEYRFLPTEKKLELLTQIVLWELRFMSAEKLIGGDAEIHKPEEARPPRLRDSEWEDQKRIRYYYYEIYSSMLEEQKEEFKKNKEGYDPYNVHRAVNQQEKQISGFNKIMNFLKEKNDPRT